MPVEFVREIENGDSLKLVMKYDGNGKRISKAMLRKLTGAAEWSVERTTRYTGIGTEIRTSNSDEKTKVVINMPQGLGRYAIEYADVNDSANAGFEWYLKNRQDSDGAEEPGPCGAQGVRHNRQPRARRRAEGGPHLRPSDSGVPAEGDGQDLQRAS